MAFGDSTEKDVRIAMSVTGAEEVRAILADIQETLRHMKTEKTDLRIGLVDPTLKAQLDEIKAKLDVLGHDPTRIKLDTTGFDETIAKLETIKRLKREASGDVNININTRGAVSALAKEEAAKKAGGGGGFFGGIASAFGQAGAGGAGTALITGAGPMAAFATSPAGAGVLAALAFPILGTIGALLTSAIGGGIAGAGVLGSYQMGSRAYAQQQSAQAAIRTSTLSLQRTTGSSIAAQQTRAQDLLRIQQNQAILKNLQQQDSAYIQIYKDIQKTAGVAKGIFSAALTTGGKNSFVNQIAADLKMVPGMLKGLQGPLTQLFQASAPYAKAFLIILDDFAKIAFPKITAALKEFTPHLPGFIRSMQIVSDVIGGLIDGFGHLAGAMADAVTKGVQMWKNGYPTFKGIFMGIRGFIDWLVQGFEQIVGAIKDVITWLGRVNGAIGGGIRGAFSKAASFLFGAGGGVIPGYAPGQDIVPAMLSPGESVLTPEATRAIGPSNILSLNALSGRPSMNAGSIVHAAGGFLSAGSFGSAGNVGGGGGGMMVVNITLSGVITNPDATARQIQQALLNLKRHNGQRALGLT